jgi:hypothetical protein
MAWYRIEVEYPDRPSDSRSFTENVTCIGREDADLVLRDVYVSRQHAELHFDGEHIVFVDLGSTSGSFDGNGEPIVEPTPLNIGDSVRVGGCRLTLHSTHLTATDTPVPRTGNRVPTERLQGDAPLPPVDENAASSQSDGLPSQGSLDFAPTPPPASSTDDVPTADVKEPNAENAGNGDLPLFPLLGRDPKRIRPEDAPTGPDLPLVKSYITEAWALVSPNLWQGFLVMGLLLVGTGLLQILLGWIPVVGPILNILLAVMQWALLPVALSALGYYSLRLYMGHPVTALEAWQAMLPYVAILWPALVVPLLISALGSTLLLVPGVILGGFMIQVFWVEGRTYHHISARCVTLWRQDPWPISLLVLGTVLASAAAIFSAGLVARFSVGFISAEAGLILAGLCTLALSSLATLVMVVATTGLYFDHRWTHDDTDARRHALSQIDRFESLDDVTE